MVNKYRYASHPGVYVKDALIELGMSQEEFASRSGLSLSLVREIINGKCPITLDSAVKLGDFFHNGFEGWLGLQSRYDLYMKSIEGK